MGIFKKIGDSIRDSREKYRQETNALVTQIKTAEIMDAAMLYYKTCRSNSGVLGLSRVTTVSSAFSARMSKIKKNDTADLNKLFAAFHALYKLSEQENDTAAYKCSQKIGRYLYNLDYHHVVEDEYQEERQDSDGEVYERTRRYYRPSDEILFKQY